jgi:hypothetical protein
MIAPYKRHPERPIMALLRTDRSVISEQGELLDLDDLHPKVRVFVSWDDCRELLQDGYGEALCWHNEEVKWRHKSFEQEWKRRPSDVNVLRIPFYEDSARTIRSLCRWRDWLCSYRAAPVGTMGSASWSLLRARLERPLWTGMGKSLPPLKQTLGGRQEVGPVGQGTFEGALRHLDLPAAYASELGFIRYGGFWHDTRRLDEGKQTPEWWARQERPTFVRARVRIPDLPFGPLVSRPRKPVYGLAAFLLAGWYPTGKVIQGFWTWDELAVAEKHGCKILKVMDIWVHISRERPFLPWWEAIERGRRMHGLSGILAKMTGNALWGQFCMDGKAGTRTIYSRQGKKTVRREVEARGGRPPSHDLAETVSGRVRAKLFDLMMTAGEDLISAHTDGAWTVEGDWLMPKGWRMKDKARKIDLINPQVLRYWPRPAAPDEPYVVFSGVPSRDAPRFFQESWDQMLAERTM